MKGGSLRPCNGSLPEGGGWSVAAGAAGKRQWSHLRKVWECEPETGVAGDVLTSDWEDGNHPEHTGGCVAAHCI